MYQIDKDYGWIRHHAPWPDYDRVLNSLYVGGEALRQKEFDDLADKVSAVIDCRIEAPDSVREEWERRGVAYKHLGVDDDLKPKPASWFHDGVAFAMPFMKRGEAVYVHCAAGINRGPSMAYGLLLALGWSPAAAEKLLRRCRPIVRIAYTSCADRALAA